MTKPDKLYVIIHKETQKISINRYLNSNIPYILGLNLRATQRKFLNTDRVETEEYIIYVVYNIDMGNRGGKREKKRGFDAFE